MRRQFRSLRSHKHHHHDRQHPRRSISPLSSKTILCTLAISLSLVSFFLCVLFFWASLLPLVGLAVLDRLYLAATGDAESLITGWCRPVGFVEVVRLPLVDEHVVAILSDCMLDRLDPYLCTIVRCIQAIVAAVQCARDVLVFVASHIASFAFLLMSILLGVVTGRGIQAWGRDAKPIPVRKPPKTLPPPVPMYTRTRPAAPLPRVDEGVGTERKRRTAAVPPRPAPRVDCAAETTPVRKTTATTTHYDDFFAKVHRSPVPAVTSPSTPCAPATRLERHRPAGRTKHEVDLRDLKVEQALEYLRFALHEMQGAGVSRADVIVGPGLYPTAGRGRNDVASAAAAWLTRKGFLWLQEPNTEAILQVVLAANPK